MIFFSVILFPDHFPLFYLILHNIPDRQTSVHLWLSALAPGRDLSSWATWAKGYHRVKPDGNGNIKTVTNTDNQLFKNPTC